MQFGISKKAREEVVDFLNDFLADTYAIYLLSQNFHYNVTGPEFFSLHLLFEKHYQELAEAVDEIAERIRTLGAPVDATFSGFKKRTSISEPAKKLSAKQMVKALVLAHEKIISFGRAKMIQLEDEVTIDLLVKRLSFHEKASWMLRSHY